jgi:hypothetical protein
MKKILSILFLALTLTLFNSCLFLLPDSLNYTPKYNITCHNQSDTRITDWCVVRNHEVTYALSGDRCCPISANGGHSTLSDLPQGKYVVYVAFVNSPDYYEGDYVKSKEITLTKDYDVYIDDSFVDEYLSNRK